MVQVGRVSQSV